MKRSHWLLAFWICATVVLVLSLAPATELTPTTGWDKSNHALAFSVLAILGCLAYSTRIQIVLVGLVLYGGFIEILQSLTPYHLAEWGDLVADIIGVAIGHGLLSLFQRIKRG